MKVGIYHIGRYHAIIKKSYEDGSVNYETSFRDAADLAESVYALMACVGSTIGTATAHPRVLTGIEVIRGKEKILAELGGRP